MYRKHNDLRGCGRDGTDRRVSRVVLQSANFLRIARVGGRGGNLAALTQVPPCRCQTVVLLSDSVFVRPSVARASRSSASRARRADRRRSILATDRAFSGLGTLLPALHDLIVEYRRPVSSANSRMLGVAAFRAVCMIIASSSCMVTVSRVRCNRIVDKPGDGGVDYLDTTHDDRSSPMRSASPSPCRSSPRTHPM